MDSTAGQTQCFNIAPVLPKKPRRKGWRRRKRERPEEIREAALEVVEQKGLAGARMAEIARRAGVTKGTLYLYFRSKQELLESLTGLTLVDRAC